MNPEKQIGIANRLYECRRTAFRIFGDDTLKVLEEWKGVIRKEMKATGQDELLSALSLAQKAEGMEREGVRIMLIMAAVHTGAPYGFKGRHFYRYGHVR